MHSVDSMRSHSVIRIPAYLLQHCFQIEVRYLRNFCRLGKYRVG